MTNDEEILKQEQMYGEGTMRKSVLKLMSLARQDALKFNPCAPHMCDTCATQQYEKGKLQGAKDEREKQDERVREARANGFSKGQEAGNQHVSIFKCACVRGDTSVKICECYKAGREETLNELTKRKIGGSASKPIIGSPIPDTDKMLKRIAELEKQVAGHQLSDTQATGVAILVREKLALEKELEHAVFCYDKKCKRCKANRILRIGKGD